jgi:uncharacterized protein YraI
MKRTLGMAIALALFAPVFAYANDGFLVSDISLQSGPDSEYPPIGDLQAGTEVDVQGCIEGYAWCDVIVGDDRGWVPGSYLEEEYDNQPVFLVDYGPRIGIPVVSFSIGTYWDAHYHNRPFYGQRTEWVNRHFTPRPPPRPSVAHAPPLPNHGGAHPAMAGHTQPAHTPPAHTPAPRTTANTPTPHPTPATEHRPVTNHDANPAETTRTRTVQRTTTTEHTNNVPANHAPPPKPKDVPKAPPKQAPKEPEHKDDDHGH